MKNEEMKNIKIIKTLKNQKIKNVIRHHSYCKEL